MAALPKNASCTKIFLKRAGPPRRPGVVLRGVNRSPKPRHSGCGNCCRARRVSQWPRVCRLARSRTATELHRRQNQPRRDQQTRRQLSQAPAGQRRTCGAAALEGRQDRSLADGLAWPQSAPGCRRGLGEQDSSHCLGNYEQTGFLPFRGSSGVICRAAAEPQACEGNEA
jgi:hypothetical protein